MPRDLAPEVDLSKLSLGELLVEVLAQFSAVAEQRAKVAALQVLLEQLEAIRDRDRAARAVVEASAEGVTLQ